jgi:hypothetical protein
LFCVLKELHRRWQRALRQRAAWERWNRKLPHNRVRRPRIRDADGRTVGYGEAVPVPEPVLPLAFCEKVVLPSGRVEAMMPDRNIEAAYRQARHPRATPKEVTPLMIREEEIRALYERCKE